MKTKQKEMLIMFKEMLIKGGLMVTALVVAETVIGKLEKRALKHDEEPKEKSDAERFEEILKERGWKEMEAE
jgi:hypothetical protein